MLRLEASRNAILLNAACGLFLMESDYGLFDTAISYLKEAYDRFTQDSQDPDYAVTSLDDEGNQTWLNEPGPSRTPLSQIEDEKEIERRFEEIKEKLEDLEDDPEED